MKVKNKIKEFNSIREIDTDTNTGKLFFASISILSSDDFKNKSKYGEHLDSKELLQNLVELADYVFNEKNEITDYIDETCDEGKMLLTTIYLLTSDKCKSGEYGGHKNVDEIIKEVRKLTVIRERERAIDLII